MRISDPETVERTPTAGSKDADAGSGWPRRNSDVCWDTFDSVEYFEHNYLLIRHDDHQIVEHIRDFFAAAASGTAPAPAIDVGTGPNVYPALAMLPFADRITLYEYSAQNVAWLKRQSAAGWPSWRNGLADIWTLYQEADEYAPVGPDPWRILSQRTEIVQGSVFDLRCAPDERYGLGTMFFVAESVSGERSEFETAIARFLDVLRPGAPFAAAFMEKSDGYQVGDIRYPATAVDAADVVTAFGHRAEELQVRHIDHDGKPLRDGYTGMLLATGHRVRERGAR
jgi:hypothetical protein